MKKILSMDGGAVRAIIQGQVLVEIETRTKKPICRLFDLIAGSSSGGNLAMGLVTPGKNGKPKYPAAEATISYKLNTPKIFSRSFFQKLNPLRDLFEEKYSIEVAADVYKNYYGWAKLSEALTPVIITAYEIEKRMAYLFHSGNAKQNPNYDFYMKDVVLSTTAAPTFFEPAKIQNIPKTDTFYFIDGAVFANNPALAALIEAKILYPKEADFLVVSLGSGFHTEPLPYNQVKNWGVAQWARPILDVVFDGVADTVDHQLTHLLKKGADNKVRYYRFQTMVSKETLVFDKTTPDNFKALENLGQKLVQDNDKELDVLCGQLLS